MELINIQKNVIINPEAIISIEKEDNKVIVNLEGGYSYEVDVPTKELLSVLSKSGIDLSKQFLSV